MKWQAVIFDMDDTLYPESAYVISGFRAVADYIEDQLSIPKGYAFDGLYDLYRQGIRGNTFDRWLNKHGFASDIWVPRFVECYRNHPPVLEPFPGIVELLDRLRLCTKLGIISDGYLGVQQQKFAALGLAHYFDIATFSDQWGREGWKPSTIPFMHTLDYLRVAPEYTVYIGDNPTKDFFGARCVGMKSIWWRREEGEYSALTPPSQEHEPDFITSDLLSLQSILFAIDN